MLPYGIRHRIVAFSSHCSVAQIDARTFRQEGTVIHLRLQHAQGKRVVTIGSLRDVIPGNDIAEERGRQERCCNCRWNEQPDSIQKSCLSDFSRRNPIAHDGRDLGAS